MAKFEKITSKEDLKAATPGTILIKYPALGTPEKAIDLSHETRFLAYEIYKINNDELELQIPETSIAPSLQVNSIPHMNGRSDEASVLVKNIDTLIKESVWWIKPEQNKGSCC
ncbi:MAG TPA: hypothetical protein VJ111_00945 [Chitinophagaceae bacterium]|nr:hypothetical protein [Chitinophagaceae bacterium]